MSRWFVKWVCVVSLVLPTAAFAQVDGDQPVVSRGQGWSLYSGQTVGSGADVVSGQVGWPGLSLQYLHGATSRFDLGVKLTPINYGFEGITNRVMPGIKIQAVARLGLVEQSRFNLGLEFAPGPMFYFPPGRNSQTLIGLSLPVRLMAGIPIGSAIMANLGLDVPFFVTFGNNSSVTIPILFGGGVEYFIDRHLEVSFNLKMGPAIYTSNFDTFRYGSADFDLEALIGVGYRF